MVGGRVRGKVWREPFVYLVFSLMKLFDNVSSWPAARHGADVRDEIVAVLALLETAKGHLGARNVLLGVLEIGILMNS